MDFLRMQRFSSLYTIPAENTTVRAQFPPRKNARANQAAQAFSFYASS